MIKNFLLLFCISTLLFGSDIANKIQLKSKTLETKSQIERKIVEKIQDVAEGILAEERNLENIKIKIEELNKNIFHSQEEINKKYEVLEKLTKNTEDLSGQKKELETKIIKIIAEDFSFYLVADSGYVDNEDGILIDEILDKMEIVIKKEFAKLATDYKQVNEQIYEHSNAVKNIKSEIKSAKNKKDELVALEKRRQRSIEVLSSKKETYKKKLQDIEKEREEIRLTLQKLKILKIEEDKKSAEAARRASLKARDKTGKVDDAGADSSVRQIGSSYQDSSVKKYTGEKTIAPLDSYTVKRKFGDYIDPIYKIKIFNESVILSSKTPDAMVKNVLSGKVIFAKDTAMLEKVVIVEHSDEIHTIYAHLSKIAPTIQVGQKIKKGYVIGRVDGDLTFEVTQKNYHINPLELISSK
ncbi:MAG: peptidoglycan DD-metalloendopeptidase family protein [Sulfurospirillaceae bacterium]|nr:peptidoglycan DD-metalloendopeptidase family protein [Sulfurospirillaceae bacterium]MDD3462364.1 peptidoglycan DD-metalloendopeptidase family protein [Sulfurospirillaceae bacterium]